MPCNRVIPVWLSAVACCLFGAFTANCQEFADEPDPEIVPLTDRLSRFFADVSAGEIDTAYQALLEGSQLATAEKAETLQELIEKTGQLEQKYGAYREFEHVGHKRVGKDLVLLTYLYKCERFPVVWYFTFYRSGSVGEATPESGPWRVVALRFDTRLELLLFH